MLEEDVCFAPTAHVAFTQFDQKQQKEKDEDNLSATSTDIDCRELRRIKRCDVIKLVEI